METLGRVNVYSVLLENNCPRLSKYVLDLVRLNKRILENIEPLFLTNDFNDKKDDLFYEYLHNVLYEFSTQEAHDLGKLYDGLKVISNSGKKAEYGFNSLIKALSEFNDKTIEQETNNHVYIFEDYPDRTLLGGGELDLNAYGYYLKNHFKKEKQVFLSYGYEDKLYTIALFFYFQMNGIFLSVDWMNNGREEKGDRLKKKLHEALEQSDQLLFLRTPNSELQIKGNYYLRPWCSWELGNYYAKSGSNEKFYINLYEQEHHDNMQLDGIRVLTDIKNEKLVGV